MVTNPRSGSRPRQLTALDATFLELEQANDSTHMHIGGALIFELPARGAAPTIDQVRATLARRLDILPRYTQRLSDPHVGGLAWPCWVEDERFDLRAHVRRATVSRPGRDGELLDWMSDFYSHRLDRTRPLWELVLLEGLADRRWALAWKTHHCLVDGVGSVDAAHLLLELDPDRHGLDEPAHPTTRAQTTRRLPGPLEQAARAGLQAGRTAGRWLGHPRDVIERWRSAAELLMRDELIAAPHSSINGPTGATRAIEAVRFPLDEIRSIASALGGTVNDVLLCAATGGLRSLLVSRGEQPPVRGLRALVPVNTRRAGGDGLLGNQVGAMFVSLPVAEPDALQRYERVHRGTAAAKARGGADGSTTLLALADLAPPILHSVLVESLDVTRLCNLTVTNVPGPPRPLYAFGSRLSEIVPVVPLASGQTVGIAVVSCAGSITFGICADRASVPDLDVLADGIFGSLVELDARAHATTDGSHATTNGSQPAGAQAPGVITPATS